MEEHTFFTQFNSQASWAIVARLAGDAELLQHEFNYRVFQI